MNDFIAGFNITVEKERKDLEEMINDLLIIEKNYFKKQELVTKFSSEGEEYQKKLDNIDLWAMEIERLIKNIRGNI